MAQRKQIPVGTMRLPVRPLATLIGLRIQRCHKLRYRLQTRLGSGITMAVAVASSHSSDSTPSLGTSIYHSHSPGKKKKSKTLVP